MSALSDDSLANLGGLMRGLSVSHRHPPAWAIRPYLGLAIRLVLNDQRTTRADAVRPVDPVGFRDELLITFGFGVGVGLAVRQGEFHRGITS